MAPQTGITSIQIPSAPIARPIVWPKRRGDNPSNIRSPTMVPMRTPTVATMMGTQSVSSTGPECRGRPVFAPHLPGTDCRRGRDESKRRKAERRQRGRAQTALIAGDAAKEAGREAQ